MISDFADAREKWLEAMPRYEALAREVRTALEGRTRTAGIAVRVEARAKDVASYLKKTVRKGYANPLAEMPDKAGARVIVANPRDVSVVETVARDEFEVLKYENHTLDHRYDQLGYLGLHLDIQLRADRASAELRTLRCEIQIHTEAQHLWDDASHRLSYKAPQNPPPGVERRIYRLAALIELFDQEVNAAREVIMSQLGFEEASMLADLEQPYYRLTGKTFDRELSVLLLRTLRRLLSADEVSRFGALMSAFVDRNARKLTSLYDSYALDTRCSPLLFQPEALLVFERMETDPFQLRDEWSRSFPPDMLEELASIWGAPV